MRQTRSLARMGLALTGALLLALSLSACGKKGTLEHPEDIETTYPRSYPSR